MARQLMERASRQAGFWSQGRSGLQPPLAHLCCARCESTEARKPGRRLGAQTWRLGGRWRAPAAARALRYSGPALVESTSRVARIQHSFQTYSTGIRICTSNGDMSRLSDATAASLILGWSVTCTTARLHAPTTLGLPCSATQLGVHRLGRRLVEAQHGRERGGGEDVGEEDREHPAVRMREPPSVSQLCL